MNTTTFDYNAECRDCVMQRPHYRDEHFKNIADTLANRGPRVEYVAGRMPDGQLIFVEARPEGRTMAAVALGAAIGGLCCGLIPLLFFMAWAGGIVGVLFGTIAMVKLGRQHASRNMAIAAIVVGVLAFAMGCIDVVILNNAFSNVNS